MKRFLGQKKILRIYIDTLDKYNNKPLWEEILLEVKKEQLAGATVIKAIAGLGAFAQLRTFKVWALEQELPLVIEIIDDEAKIYDFIEHIDSMIENGLVTITDTQVIKYKHKNFNTQEK